MRRTPKSADADGDLQIDIDALGRRSSFCCKESIVWMQRAVLVVSVLFLAGNNVIGIIFWNDFSTFVFGRRMLMAEASLDEVSIIA
jgi:hypothetical protein